MLNQPIQTDLVYSGIVTEASSTEPGRDHTYSVRVAALNLTFNGVAPQGQLRWRRGSDDIDMLPFPVGTRVAVHLVESGSQVVAIIETQELPAIGAC